MLPVKDLVKIEMPMNAEIISCKIQNGNICLWAIVETDTPYEERTFRIAGTGHPLELQYVTREDMTYIDTIVGFMGGLVFHIFEVKQ